jgi:hypothetical protein
MISPPTREIQLSHYFVGIQLDRMASGWENKVRGDLCYKLMTYPEGPIYDPYIQLKIIHKCIVFFPLRGIPPASWKKFVSWYISDSSIEVSKKWERFCGWIELHYQDLEDEYDEHKEHYGSAYESETDDGGEQLQALPRIFSSKFMRIDERIVANEWMLSKVRRSRFSILPNALHRVGLP